MQALADHPEFCSQLVMYSAVEPDTGVGSYVTENAMVKLAPLLSSVRSPLR